MAEENTRWSWKGGSLWFCAQPGEKSTIQKQPCRSAAANWIFTHMVLNYSIFNFNGWTALRVTAIFCDLRLLTQLILHLKQESSRLITNILPISRTACSLPIVWYQWPTQRAWNPSPQCYMAKEKHASQSHVCPADSAKWNVTTEFRARDALTATTPNYV